MTGKQHLAHIVSVILTAVAAVVTPALMPGGALASYSWAPLALATLAYIARAVAKGAVPPAVLLLVAIGLSSCGITGPVPPPNTPGITNCSDAALHQAELNILPAVENALASPNWESALLAIVASVGGPLALTEVSCVVAWVEEEATKAAATTADSLEATKAAHAKAWLAKYAPGT
jgi:hypothetical protein